METPKIEVKTGSAPLTTFDEFRMAMVPVFGDRFAAEEPQITGYEPLKYYGAKNSKKLTLTPGVATAMGLPETSLPCWSIRDKNNGLTIIFDHKVSPPSGRDKNSYEYMAIYVQEDETQAADCWLTYSRRPNEKEVFEDAADLFDVGTASKAGPELTDELRQMLLFQRQTILSSIRKVAGRAIDTHSPNRQI